MCFAAVRTGSMMNNAGEGFDLRETRIPNLQGPTLFECGPDGQPELHPARQRFQEASKFHGIMAREPTGEKKTFL